MIPRRLIDLLIAALLAGCSRPAERAASSASPGGGPPATAPSSSGPKIGIMTSTVSQGEEDYRAGQQIAARYPGRVKTVTFPDNFSTEVETVISQLVGLSTDPDVKVVVAAQAVPGSVAAARKIRESRPDVLIGFMLPHEDPDITQRVSDLAMQPDELARGTSIIDEAAEMGAKHFVHYSFPRHMAMVLLARRRDLMITECAKRGIEFHFVTAPDPTGESGLPGTQQFILEDVPRELAKYGPQTAFFSTNDGMQEPLIKAILTAKQGYFVEQSTPAPTAGFPAALGLAIPPGKAGDMAWISGENRRLIAAKGMSGHFGTWSQSIDMVETRAICTLLMDAAAKQADARDSATVQRYVEREAGGPVHLHRYSPNGNQWLVLLQHVTY